MRIVNDLQKRQGYAFMDSIYKNMRDMAVDYNVLGVYLSRLVKQGYLKRVARGVYQITKKGMREIEPSAR